MAIANHSRESTFHSEPFNLTFEIAEAVKKSFNHMLQMKREREKKVLRLFFVFIRPSLIRKKTCQLDQKTVFSPKKFFFFRG
jgi:hypothetical protein